MSKNEKKFDVLSAVLRSAAVEDIRCILAAPYEEENVHVKISNNEPFFLIKWFNVIKSLFKKKKKITDPFILEMYNKKGRLQKLAGIPAKEEFKKYLDETEKPKMTITIKGKSHNDEMVTLKFNL